MASTISAGLTTTTALVYSADTSGVLQLQTNGTTTAVTIDTAQNVGVGVTPSASWATNWKGVQFSGAGSLFGNTAGNQISLYFNTINGTSNNLYQNNGYATYYSQGAGTGQHAWYVAPSGTAGNAITFTQAMTLLNSGALLVGQTSQNNSEIFGITQSSGNYTSQFTNSASSNPQGLFIKYTGASPNSAGANFIQCQDNGPTNRFVVNSNGGVANYQANNTNLSDATMKKDITPAKSYLSILDQIPVVTFLFNDQTDTDLNIGVTAQSVQSVAPELVGIMDIGTKEAPNVKLAIYETDLKYAMLKSIQELSAQVTALQAKVGI